MSRKKAAGIKPVLCVTPVRVEGASAMLTITANDPVWMDWTEEREVTAFVPVKSGGFARVMPPVTATDEDLHCVVAALKKAGYTTVKVLPRPAAKVVPEGAHTAPAPGRATLRDTVLRLVGESNVGDRDALRALTEAAMSEVGL